MSTTNDYKIAIIGPADTVSGFKAMGVEAFDAQTGEQALEQLRGIKQQTLDPQSPERFAVVCIIEDLLVGVDQAEFAKIVHGPLPAVIALPGPAGSSGVAIARLRRLAEQAVGSAII
jgi:V/A-type H+-transporting ATPase subunit F